MFFLIFRRNCRRCRSLTFAIRTHGRGNSFLKCPPFVTISDRLTAWPQSDLNCPTACESRPTKFYRTCIIARIVYFDASKRSCLRWIIDLSSKCWPLLSLNAVAVTASNDPGQMLPRWLCPCYDVRVEVFSLFLPDVLLGCCWSLCCGAVSYFIPEFRKAFELGDLSVGSADRNGIRAVSVRRIYLVETKSEYYIACLSLAHFEVQNC